MTGFREYLNRAIVGVDNLGDPLRFDVFYGLPRSSAPTAEDGKCCFFRAAEVCTV